MVRVTVGVRVDLVVEVVHEAGDAPELLVLAPLAGVGAHGRLDGQHVPAAGSRP